jgi:NAD(P)-dependent dehydrogenase (short-subunit alcohol dehydrogenase family)
MTEAEWQACGDPLLMLRFLRDRASERKLRLLAVAACREIWDRITDGRSREAVVVAEMFADGLAGDADLLRACQSAHDASTAAHAQSPEQVDEVVAFLALDASLVTGQVLIVDGERTM